ncbi:MAG: HAMP domain-containing protein [Desulfobacterales bacterium]|nr:HAMP domain-containing protein [Desulfobacterales bacterium]
MKMFKLSTQLNIAFFIALFIPITLATLFSIVYYNAKIKNEALNKISSELKVASIIYDNAIVEMKNIAKTYSQEKALTALFVFNLGEKLGIELAKLAPTYKVNTIVFMDTNYKVVARSSDPKKLGDIIPENIYIKKAFTGEITSGTELVPPKELEQEGIHTESLGPYIMSMTSAAPVYDRKQENIVGAVLIRRILNANEAVIQKIDDVIGKSMALFAYDTMIVSKFYEDVLPIHKMPSHILETINQGQSFEESLIRRHGYLVKYQPVFNIDNTPIGAMMIKCSANEYLETMITAILSLIGIAFIGFLLSFIIKLVIQRRILRPIKILTQGMEVISQGQYEYEIQFVSRDEMGFLASSFNTMTKQLDYSHKELKKYSEELEKRVQERTEELTKSRSEMRMILDNIPLGITTINKDKKINHEYSIFMHNLFKNHKIIKGKAFEDIYIEQGKEEEQEIARKWIDMVMSNAYAWDLIADIGPNMLIHTAHDQVFYYQNSFYPITIDNHFESLLVITKDITEQKRLELAVKTQEESHHQELEIISAIINQDRCEFENYIKEAGNILEQVNHLFETLKEDSHNIGICNTMFRLMHSLKGNSRAFKMTKLGEYAHEVEDVLSGIREKEITLTTELFDGELASDNIHSKFIKMNSIIDNAKEILKKISGEPDQDLGTRKNDTARPIKIEPEVITDLINQCDSLEKMIDGADSIKTTQHIKNILFKLTLIPLDSAYNRFKTIISDLASVCNKQVELKFEGDPVYLPDKSHHLMINSLVHILRNAVDHGLETPDIREMTGKNVKGEIVLHTQTTDHHIIIEIKDDGDGIDSEIVLKKAIAKGLIDESKAETMSPQEIIELILLPGFSTSEEVSDISGRGVGMDVVVDTVTQLSGKLEIESNLGVGTKFTIILPSISDSSRLFA